MKRASLVFMLAAVGSALSPHTTTAVDFQIRNDVSACVAFSIEGQSRVGQIAVAQITADQLQPLGACGCRSKVLAYRVMERIGPNDEVAKLERVFGRVVLAPRLTLMIASDVDLVGRGPRTLEFACAPDD